MMPWGLYAAEINVCNPFTNGVLSAYVSNEASPLVLKYDSEFNNVTPFIDSTLVNFLSLS